MIINVIGNKIVIFAGCGGAMSFVQQYVLGPFVTQSLVLQTLQGENFWKLFRSFSTLHRQV